MTNQGWIWNQVMEDGFEGVHRVHKPKRELDFDDFYYRSLRRSHTYADYAKDLCKNYVRDRNKVNFCIKNKRYIGVSKEEFTILNTDCRFMTSCFDTVLLEYKDYFTERYIDKLSVRKYAEAHNMSRGSVEHIERKMLQQLALELKLRDDNDKKIRIKPVTADDEEE